MVLAAVAAIVLYFVAHILIVVFMIVLIVGAVLWAANQLL